MKSFYWLARLLVCLMLTDVLAASEDLSLAPSSDVEPTAYAENSEAPAGCSKCGRQNPPQQQRPWSLFGKCSSLNALGINISGYIQQSMVTDSRNPTNPPASFGTWPGAGFQYRNDEYMFNRLYLGIGRETNTGGDGWDIGGKVDLLYGTDYVFLQARGLETRSDLSPKWNPSTGVGFGGVGLMGLAMPAIYTEVAYNDLKAKLGRFYHPAGFIGFDPVRGILGNTNTYTLIYNSILPVTGMLGEWRANDRLSIGGGFHRGSGNWEDNNNHLNAVGLINWQLRDGKSSIKYVFDIGAEDDDAEQDQFFQSIVVDLKLTEKWTYVFQSHYRNVQNSLTGGGDDNFYSVVNRLAYNVNEKTIVGVRYEWFDDTNGTAIFPPSINPGPGIWHGLSFGGTYKYCPNLWLRPQIRWDWLDADPGVGPGPWGDGTERSRFISSFSVFTFF